MNIKTFRFHEFLSKEFTDEENFNIGKDFYIKM